MKKNGLLLTVALVVLALLWPEPATSQQYPTRPLEIICPYSAGGSLDVVARVVAEIGAKYFGQPIVVVNKPGAAGSLAAADVISSKPDGYKAFWSGPAFYATTVRTQKVPFDPNDLVPLANFIELKQGMFVRADSPFKTFNDLLDYAAKNPDQLTWGHPGRGIILHMTPLIMFKKRGVRTIDVPYKGVPEALVALLGKHMDAGSFVYGPVVENLKAGKVRMLVVYSEKRYQELPSVPTLEELGYPEAYMATLIGLNVHKNTPDTVKKKLLDVSKKIYDDPEFKKAVEKQGEVPVWGGPDFLRNAIKKQEQVGIPILKDLGLYVGK